MQQLPYIQQLSLDIPSISLDILRDDLNHPIISGNKLRKLKYNLKAIIDSKKEGFITFGGAYSNHIVASAFAAKEQGLKSIGIIRGEELGKNLSLTLKNNPSLAEAHQYGMEFLFVAREIYRQRDKPDFLAHLQVLYPNYTIIPEGGTTFLAMHGLVELFDGVDLSKYTHIAVSMGTGGTISGILQATLPNQRVLGFAALNTISFYSEVLAQYSSNKNYELFKDVYFGGYGRYNESLIEFINIIYSTYQLPLDPIYTGKMMYQLLELIKHNYFAKQATILAIHTGGLQGIRGINQLQQKKGGALIQIEI